MIQYFWSDKLVKGLGWKFCRFFLPVLIFCVSKKKKLKVFQCNALVLILQKNFVDFMACMLYDSILLQNCDFWHLFKIFCMCSILITIYFVRLFYSVEFCLHCMIFNKGCFKYELDSKNIDCMKILLTFYRLPVKTLWFYNQLAHMFYVSHGLPSYSHLVVHVIAIFFIENRKTNVCIEGWWCVLC